MDFIDEVRKLNSKGKYNTPRQVRNLMSRALSRVEDCAVPEIEKCKVLLQGAKWLGELQKSNALEQKLAKLEKTLNKLIEAQEGERSMPWSVPGKESNVSHKPNTDA